MCSKRIINPTALGPLLVIRSDPLVASGKVNRNGAWCAVVAPTIYKTNPHAFFSSI